MDAEEDEYRIASGSSFWGGLAAHRHLVLAGAEDGKLYAFDTRRGRQAWAYATGGPIAAPALSDGTRVFLPARDGYIYVLSTEGTLVERLDMTYVVTARSAQANGFAYFLGNNRARAFETDGDEWWTMSFDAETPVHVVAGGDRVVVVTDKPWIYALPADAR